MNVVVYVDVMGGHHGHGATTSTFFRADGRAALIGDPGSKLKGQPFSRLAFQFDTLAREAAFRVDVLVCSHEGAHRQMYHTSPVDSSGPPSIATAEGFQWLSLCPFPTSTSTLQLPPTW